MKINNNEDLGKCTRTELISYIKETHWLRSFKFSNILLKRWRLKSDALAVKRELNLDCLPTSEEAKQQDILASQFNKEIDITKRIVIINKMKPYHKKMEKYIAIEKQLDKEEKALNKLYESIDIQRQKENENERKEK